MTDVSAATSSSAILLQRQRLLLNTDADDSDDVVMFRSKVLDSRKKKLHRRQPSHRTARGEGEAQSKQYDFSPIDGAAENDSEALSLQPRISKLPDFNAQTILLLEEKEDRSLNKISPPQEPPSVFSSSHSTTTTSAGSCNGILTNPNNTGCESPHNKAKTLTPSTSSTVPLSPQSPSLPFKSSIIPFLRRHKRRLNTLSKTTTTSTKTVTTTLPKTAEAAKLIEKSNYDDNFKGEMRRSDAKFEQQATIYTQSASQYYQQQLYTEAYTSYERAVQVYNVQLAPFIQATSLSINSQRIENPFVYEQLFSKDSSVSPSDDSICASSSLILLALNAAGCYRNLSVIARIKRLSSNTIHHHLQCAEYLYDLVLERLQQCQEHQTEPSSINTADATTNSEVSSSSHEEVETVCVQQLIIETMQSRALCYIKYNKDVESALACHEKCLLQLKLLKHPTNASSLSSTEKNCMGVMYGKMDGIVFESISKNKWIELFMYSIQYLCTMYRTNIPSSITKLMLLQEAINLMEDEIQWHLFDSVTTAKNPVEPTMLSQQKLIIKSTSDTLRSLSQIYIEFSNRCVKDHLTVDEAMDYSIQTLKDAIDVELQSYNCFSHDVQALVEYLLAMDDLGATNEQRQQYDKALLCYEKVLLTRSKYLGDHDVDVAKSLINTARIMELQGNVEGSLDLYRAAHSIYTYQITSTHDTVFASCEDATEILQLIPNLLETERYNEARAYLMKCLAIVESEEQTNDSASKVGVDKSIIYFDLSQAYIGLKDYVSATIYLLEAGKVENGKITEAEVITAIRQVEVLQRRDDHHGIPQQVRDDPCDHLLHKIYSLDESIRQSCSLDDQLNYLSSNIITLPSKESLMSKLSFRPSSLSSSNKKHTSKHRNKTHLRSNTEGTLSSKDDPIESVLSGFTSLLQSDSSQYSTSKDVGDITSLFNDDTNIDLKTGLPSMISDLTLTLKEDVIYRYVNSHTTISTATIPTIDLVSDVEPNFRADVFDPLKNAERQRHFPDDEPSIRLHEHSIVSTMSESMISSKNYQKETVHNDKSVRGSLPSSPSLSPRRCKDEKSTSSSQKQRPIFPKVFGEKSYRRSRREGFQTLSDSSPSHRNSSKGIESELKCQEDMTEEGSTSTVSFPVLVINENYVDDDDISDITNRYVAIDPNSTSGATNQEWWWGITTEGIGRWFPTAYVTQAVQAADAFLSAKAIHSKSARSVSDSQRIVTSNNGAKVPLLRQVESNKKDNDDDSECPSEGATDDRNDIASHVGITSINASRANLFDFVDGKEGKAFEADGKWMRTQSFPADFFSSSPSRRRLGYDCENDIESEILACRELLIAQQREYGTFHLFVANTLFKLAILCSRNSDLDAAIESANEALRIQMKMSNITDCIQSLHFLADLYLHHKEYKHALSHYERALEYETNFYGYISDPVAKTLNCIGTVKLLQHSYRSSMESHEQALCILNECHDNKEYDASDSRSHPLITETLCHIGNVYFRERHQDNERMCNKTITSFTGSKDSYASHFDRHMLEQIGHAYEVRGLYNMAIYFLQEVSEYLESSTIDQTADVLFESAKIYNQLGVLCCNSGLYSVAIQYHERALSIHLQSDCDEIQIAKARVYTGNVLYELGQYEVALQSYQDALEYYQNEENGDELQHNVAATMYLIGKVHVSLCDYDLAMETFKAAYDVQEGIHGTDNPSSLRTKREILNLHILRSEIDAKKYVDDLQNILNTQKVYYEGNHPNVAETIHSIALAHIGQKEYKIALRLLEECYLIRYDFFRNDHPIQATTLYDIARVHFLLGESYTKSLQICDAVLNIRLSKLGKEHIDIARTYMLKGACLVAATRKFHNSVGKHNGSKDGYEYLLDAYNMSIKCLNGKEEHLVIAEIYAELSMYHLLDCQFDMALSYIHQVLSIYKKLHFLSTDYYGIINAQNILNRIEHDEKLCV